MIRILIMIALMASALMSEETAENIPFVRHLSASYVEVTCVHVEYGKIIKKQVHVINRNAIVRLTMSNHDADGPLPGGDPPVKYKNKHVYRVIMNHGDDVERSIPCGIRFVHDVTEKMADDFAERLQLPGFHDFVSLIDQGTTRR